MFSRLGKVVWRSISKPFCTLFLSNYVDFGEDQNPIPLRLHGLYLHLSDLKDSLKMP